MELCLFIGVLISLLERLTSYALRWRIMLKRPNINNMTVMTSYPYRALILEILKEQVGTRED